MFSYNVAMFTKQISANRLSATNCTVGDNQRAFEWATSLQYDLVELTANGGLFVSLRSVADDEGSNETGSLVVG